MSLARRETSATNPFRVQRRSLCVSSSVVFSLLFCCSGLRFRSERSPSKARPGSVSPAFKLNSSAPLMTRVSPRKPPLGDGTRAFPRTSRTGNIGSSSSRPDLQSSRRPVSLPQTQSLTVELQLTTAPQTVVVTGSSTPSLATSRRIRRPAQQRSTQAAQPRRDQRRPALHPRRGRECLGTDGRHLQPLRARR